MHREKAFFSALAPGGFKQLAAVSLFVLHKQLRKEGRAIKGKSSHARQRLCLTGVRIKGRGVLRESSLILSSFLPHCSQHPI